MVTYLTSPYLQRQHFKFSTLVNTSSISCHCFCFFHLLTYSVNTSSSQHLSTLPAFLVISSVSHISLPTVSTLQVLNTSQHFQHFLSSLLFLTSPTSDSPTELEPVEANISSTSSPFHLHIIGNQVDLGSFHKQYFF